MTRYTESDLPFLMRHSRQGAGKGTLGKEKPLSGQPALSEPKKRQSVGTRNGKAPGPNKTEAEYGRLLELEFPGCPITFEGITLHMANSHKYTPDFCIQMPGGWMLLVEVKARGKNGFRLPSYQRAKLAYDQCKEEFGIFRYRWAEKQNGKWSVHGS